jgi:hypothetical protein
MSVDLPMPGGPARSTTWPGTTPPPNRRSSSGTPVAVRVSGVSLASLSATTADEKLISWPEACATDSTRAPGRASTTSSAIVFHSEQPGHWPIGFMAEWPQDWQR